MFSEGALIRPMAHGLAHGLRTTIKVAGTWIRLAICMNQQNNINNNNRVRLASLHQRSTMLRQAMVKVLMTNLQFDPVSLQDPTIQTVMDPPKNKVGEETGEEEVGQAHPDKFKRSSLREMSLTFTLTK